MVKTNLIRKFEFPNLATKPIVEDITEQQEELVDGIDFAWANGVYL